MAQSIQPSTSETFIANLKQAPLIHQIQLEHTDLELLKPAATPQTRLIEGFNAQIDEYNKEIVQIKAEHVNEEAQYLTEKETTEAKTKEEIAALNKLAESALPFELEKINASLKIREEVIDELKYFRSKAEKAISDIYESVQAIEEKKRMIVDTFNAVHTHFPNAEVLDLSCLWQFRSKEGLPKLGWILADAPGTQASISLGSRNLDIFDDEITKKLTSMICGATGVSTWYCDRSKAEAYAQELGKLNSVTSGLPASAERIELQGEFDCDVVPEEARQIIRAAVNLKGNCFDRVIILGEVPTWNLVYSNVARPFSPFIEGKIVFPQPDYRDPLIIGLKKLPCAKADSLYSEEKTVAFLLGAYNTSAVEDWIAAELTQKIE